MKEEEVEEEARVFFLRVGVAMVQWLKRSVVKKFDLIIPPWLDTLI